MSPYYSNGDTFPHTPEAEETLPSTLPTVYSPTPSLPTMASPSSAATDAEGKGYLEIYKVPYQPRYIDAQSSVPTAPSFSTRSSPFDEAPLMHSYAQKSTTESATLPSSDPIPLETAIVGRPSFRVHRKPSRPLSRLPSMHRRVSIRSSVEASHGSCNVYAIYKSFCLFLLLLDFILWILFPRNRTPPCLYTFFALNFHNWLVNKIYFRTNLMYLTFFYSC